MDTRLRHHIRRRPAYWHPVCKLAGGVAMRTAADITADPRPVPWSRQQLQYMMRQAGWKRVPGPGSCYKHQETGKSIELLNWNADYRRPEWRVWAEKREVPPK